MKPETADYLNNTLTLTPAPVDPQPPAQRPPCCRLRRARLLTTLARCRHPGPFLSRHLPKAQHNPSPAAARSSSPAPAASRKPEAVLRAGVGLPGDARAAGGEEPEREASPGPHPAAWQPRRRRKEKGGSRVWQPLRTVGRAT